jgi:hypothetical protein
VIPRSLAAFAVATLFVARAAKAEEEEPIRIDFTAPAECPSEAAFVAQLKARTPRVRIVGEGEAERRIFRVELKSRDQTFQGRLEIRSNGRVSSRELNGDTCDEVENALALVTALAIDPHATTSAVVVPPVVAYQEASPTPPPPDEPTSPPSPPPDVPVAPPNPRVAEWQIAVGAGGGVRSGLLPSAAPDIVAGAAISRTHGAFPFEVRLVFVQAISQTVSSPGDIAFDFRGGRLDGCPARFGTTSLHVLPCGVFEIGSLSAASIGVLDPQSRHRVWTSTGISGRVEWEFVRHLQLEAALDGLAAIQRDRFYFAPNVTAYRSPPVGAGASLGVAWLALP